MSLLGDFLSRFWRSYGKPFSLGLLLQCWRSQIDLFGSAALILLVVPKNIIRNLAETRIHGTVKFTLHRNFRDDTRVVFTHFITIPLLDNPLFGRLNADHGDYSNSNPCR